MPVNEFAYLRQIETKNAGCKIDIKKNNSDGKLSIYRGTYLTDNKGYIA